ncbi:hypothetical protein [Streptomyces sp. cmx-18-6]|uniref:hypothetical protein n=1 Tax=Streptomyces sp. cmx-18-6 TaxID=2790930 RepID=UPI00398123A4
MSDRSGILTAHENFSAPVRLVSGETATLHISNVQFLSAPHDDLLRLVHRNNPVVQHFFAVNGSTRTEVVHHPGFVAHAGHAAEHFAFSVMYHLALSNVLKGIEKNAARDGVPTWNAATGQTSAFSYHPVHQIADGTVAARFGYTAGKHAWGGIRDASAAVEDLIDWVLREPGRGYYVIENGRPQARPVIEHEIRYRDLTRV